MRTCVLSIMNEQFVL